MPGTQSLDLLVERLSRRIELGYQDIAAIRALPFEPRQVAANTYLVREGERPHRHCDLIMSGLAFRHKLTAAGARQIVSLHLKGDLLDLQHLFLNIADHSLQALTNMEVAEVDRAALQAIALQRPAVGQALWIEGLVDASICREWILNVGRRDARERIAHLICELAVRMQSAGIVGDTAFEFPMTQEQIGDATGMTGVHVNRTLKALAADGLIDQSKRRLSIVDWNGIRRAGDFNPLYLHLDQIAHGFEGHLTVSPLMTQSVPR